MTAQQILLHLSLIEGIGPATVGRILAHKDQRALSELYAMSSTDIIQYYGFSSALSAKLVAGLTNKVLFEREIALIEKYQITWSTLIDESYPTLLKHIYAPPTVLYWRGALENQEKSIALVGSRQANRYGQQVIEQLVLALVEQGWTIVSGGALGADSMAHRAAITANGKTVVVLGSGLLKPYPFSNKKLFDDVVSAGGALVSCFPLTMEALPGNFPARNRIIAGLSRACVVVQAAAQSGALITAQFALEQGREVCAVPGSITDPLSAGCHALIQQGAALVTCADDILLTCGFDVPKKQDIPTAKISNCVKSPPAKTVEYDANDITSAGIIMRHCATPCSLDDLLVHTNMPLPDLNSVLFDLQLQGKLVQNFTGMWEVVEH